MTDGLSMRFVGVGRPLEPLRRPIPEPGAGEILVRALACTICGSDRHSLEGRRPSAAPAVLGHEIVGEIAAFGAGAPRIDAAGLPLAEGTRLTWSLVASCGGCFYCQNLLPQKCAAGFKYGHQSDDLAPWSGGLADVVLLRPGTTLAALPADMPLARACPANCATATVMAAVRRLPAAPGVALVTGLGMLGLTATAALARRGWRVVATDPFPERRAWAKRFGADAAPAQADLAAAVAERTAGRGADGLMDFSGHPAAMAAGLDLLRLGGNAVWAGAVMPVPWPNIAADRLVKSEWTLHGVHNYQPRDLLEAVRFLDAARDLPFEELVSAWTPLEQADAAFELAGRPEHVRVEVRTRFTPAD